jgi:hypothetical protein
LRVYVSQFVSVWGQDKYQFDTICWPVRKIGLFSNKTMGSLLLIVLDVHFIWSTHMRLTTTIAAAAVIAVSGVAANAGGLSVAAADDTVTVLPAPTAPASSVNSGYIVLGLLAALVAASASF